jgi:hypothetical protein
MDATRVREDFEGLTHDQQVEFMASVGPAFCRKVMVDPALRRQMMARCFAERCVLRGAVREGLRALAALPPALLAGLRAGLESWRKERAAGSPEGIA